jgi:hypothetical protein
MVDAPLRQTEKVVSAIELMYFDSQQASLPMNTLSEQQARARQLSLPRDWSAHRRESRIRRRAATQRHVRGIQSANDGQHGAARRLRFLCDRWSRQHFAPERQLRKSAPRALGPGQWYGEREVFLRTALEEETFAEGAVILWTIPPDTLRDLFFASPAAMQLLYNFGVLLAQRLSVKAQADSPVEALTAD